MSVQPVRFALVGLGRAGQFHIQSVKLLGPRIAQLRWVVDIDEEKCKEVAEDMHCKWSTDADAVYNDPEVDAVIIASVTDTHYGYCKGALSASKAVFTEKPISHNPVEVKEIVEIAKASKLPFIVGYQRRVDKEFLALKKLVGNGAVGDLRIIKCCSRDNPIPPIAYLKTSGGIFHDMLSHDFDMLHFLSGQFPESVYSVGHCYSPEIKELDDADTVVVTLSFASGLLATVDTSRVAEYGYDQRVEVFGEHGMAKAQNVHEHSVEVATKGGYTTPVAEWSFPQRYKHTYTVELEKFCEMMRQSPPVCEEDALLDRHVILEKVATGAEISWRIGRKVLLSEVDELRSVLPNHH